MGFQVTLGNVLVSLLYALLGFVLYKGKKASAEHLSTLSAILVYVCGPCMIVSSFLSMDYSLERLAYMGLFFLVTLLLQSVVMAALYLVFRKKYADPKYRLMTIGCVLGNVGFFGLPVIRAIFPDNPEVACYSSVYVISMNLLVFTMGVYCLTGDKSFVSVKNALFNPTMLGLVVGLPCFLTGARAYLPEMLVSGVNLLGNMTTPVCMIILGIRLASVSFRGLFLRPYVYLICLGKLIIFPLFCYLAVCFLPLPETFKASVLILSGTPCASVILNMAEMYHGERELAANCVLLGTMFCLFTVPLITLLL
ncbi:MAG: AEC family transporter [Christensenellaceae bacterium]